MESTIEQVLVAPINNTLKSWDSFLATHQNSIATVLSMKNDIVHINIGLSLQDAENLLVEQ